MTERTFKEVLDCWDIDPASFEFPPLAVLAEKARYCPQPECRHPREGAFDILGLPLSAISQNCLLLNEASVIYLKDSSMRLGFFMDRLLGPPEELLSFRFNPFLLFAEPATRSGRPLLESLEAALMSRLKAQTAGLLPLLMRPPPYTGEKIYLWSNFDLREMRIAELFFSKLTSRLLVVPRDVVSFPGGDSHALSTVTFGTCRALYAPVLPEDDDEVLSTLKVLSAEMPFFDALKASRNLHD